MAVKKVVRRGTANGVGAGKTKSRTPDELVKFHEENAEVSWITKLKVEELENLIDEAGSWDIAQKELSAKVTTAKAILLLHAKSKKWKEKFGKDMKCVIGSSSTSVIGSVKDFLALLKKEKKQKLFYDLVSVKLGDAKKYLGEEALKTNGWLRTEAKPYSSVSLKAKKK